MQAALEGAEPDKTQRQYARLAGVVLLAEIVLAVGAGLLLSRIEGGGTPAEIARRIAASEHLYRAALSVVVLVTLGSAVLAFALYVTLRPINPLLAQLAMIFSLGDSFLALVVRTCSFVRVHLYTSAQNAGLPWEAFSGLMRSIGSLAENIGGISFGIGSVLFFHLFFKSDYIPRVLSGFGLAAAMVWTALYFASLVFPAERSSLMRICLPLMALAEVATAFYLVRFAARPARTTLAPT
jgi:hypothetical protein